jgi:capsular polysaccharide biosynthesis protein
VSTSAWHLEDDGFGGPDSGPAAAGTVSLAFIRATLRRLWYVWVACALAGATLALAFLVLLPPASVGTVTLLLAHDPSTQPDEAMATDVRLLETRTVAQQVSDHLGLDVAPDDLLKSVAVLPTTSSVLEVRITGTSPEDAVRRAQVLGATYLKFRGEQLRQQNDAVSDGYQQRINSLQTQYNDLTQQFDALTEEEQAGEQGAELLSARGQQTADIAQLQNQVQAEALEVNAVVNASRVIDPASLVPAAGLRRAVLALGSGLIGGFAVGFGLVVLYAITTVRLRSRADVAAAMRLPVMFSAGNVARRWRRPGRRERAALELLVDGMTSALPTPARSPERLGLVTVDCEREGAKVVARLANRLVLERSVVVVDPAQTGLLDRELANTAVDPDAEPDATADLILTLVPFEVGRGLAHVKSTSPRCVILVKAGESTAESLGTVAQSARAAGLDVAFVMLVGADAFDASYGGAPAMERVARLS